jgi:hypothetical protein
MLLHWSQRLWPTLTPERQMSSLHWPNLQHQLQSHWLLSLWLWLLPQRLPHQKLWLSPWQLSQLRPWQKLLTQMQTHLHLSPTLMLHLLW